MFFSPWMTRMTRILGLLANCLIAVALGACDASHLKNDTDWCAKRCAGFECTAVMPTFSTRVACCPHSCNSLIVLRITGQEFVKFV